MDDCTKIPYRTRGEAKHVLRTIKSRRAAGRGLKVYECDRCGLWHLGHPIRKGKRGIRPETKGEGCTT